MRNAIVSVLARVCLAFALVGCGATTSSSAVDEPVVDEVSERSLPALRRVGDLATDEYLFAREALGEGRDALVRARLIAVEPDAFTVSVDGGPHRSVSRRDGWPMACLRGPLRHAEGDLVVQLAAGAPVFVLASNREAARVSVGLASEHSRVVPRDALTLEGCATDAPSDGARRVARVGEGDVPCLFADQETLDPSAGLPVAAGAPARVLEEDGEWARVEVSARGGTLRGWMGATLVSGDGAAPDWDAVALRTAQCMFPGRADPRSTTLEGASQPGLPSIPASEIERVVRNNAAQIDACYEARRTERPDLRVVLDLILLVDADGQVSSARVTRGASVDEALTRCVIERVRRWRFPAPRFGSVELQRTFDLRPR